ncbi:MAG TPA: SDR family NAD(P)-dependent oxidoreductase [Thermoleophilaceae bacterium]|jgi:NAD(P)-dependent dehydrogenase (short-subunit alcohol dehydrogenase family)
MAEAPRTPCSVLVAGGTGALGAAVLRELLDAGHPVTATWLVERERERVEAELGDREALTLVEADLMELEGAEAAVAATPALGAVVNLVGGFASGPLAHETHPDEFDRMLRLNVRPGCCLVCAAMPRLLEAGGGAYVGVSARPALKPFAGAASYVTAKAAVLAFISALDADYAKQGIRANAVLPSVIDTPANRAATPDADFSKWVQPAEIARVIRFLVSDDAAVTSGAAVPVYGRA